MAFPAAWRAARRALPFAGLPLAGLRGRPLRLLWSVQLALCLLIAGTTGMLVMQLRDSALRQADHELNSLAVILADQAERAFQAVDLVQSGLFADLGADGIRSPDDLRQRYAGINVHERLGSQDKVLPQLDLIALVGADGLFINISSQYPPPKNSVADRNYFSILKNHPDQDVFISDPLQNRLSHTWAIVVAHAVRAPDRTFLGITFAGVQMRYFEKLYEQVANRADMSVALVRNDGVLLARYPAADARLGQPYPEAVMPGQAPQGSAADDLERRTRLVDGVPRLIASHALEHFPFLFSVSASIPTIMVPWRQQAAYLVGAAVLLVIVFTGLAMLMSWHLRNQSILTEARAARAEAEAARRGAEAELAVGRERDRASREIRVQNLRFGAALSNMSQALCMFDDSDALVVANRRVGELFAIPATDVAPGLSIAELRALLTSKAGLLPQDVEGMLAGVGLLRAAGKRGAYVVELQDGRSISVNFAPVEDGGWLVTLEDITERRLVEARISHMAHHDALTGLPNRVLFHERLTEAVARSRRGETCAILFLDLDHFKSVNDTLGHPVGDALLREVTARLLKAVRETDTVARLGGDEFAIVQTRLERPEHTTTLAARIIDVVSKPYELEGQQVTIGTSIGIAIAPDDGEDPDQLLKSADMALYRAKEEGRGRYRHFEPEMDTRLRARRQLEVDLRKALAEGEMRVFYQPLIDIKSRSVCGFEALVRWFHPERGSVSPAEFVPVAEEIGLIVPLGEWVLRQACADAVTWPGKMKVAVNLSPIQLARRSIVADIAAALADSGLEPRRLELEITETAMIEDTESVLVTLHQIKDIGVRIAMDDFGTGYSSLSYLLRFPFNKVKIDRSFVDDVGKGGDADVIVAAVINLCNALGMTITAEGVETQQQLGYIASRHCTEAQGYLFSKPRAAAEVPAMIRASELQFENAPRASVGAPDF